MQRSLVGSEMCIRDSICRPVRADKPPRPLAAVERGGRQEVGGLGFRRCCVSGRSFYTSKSFPDATPRPFSGFCASKKRFSDFPDGIPSPFSGVSTPITDVRLRGSVRRRCEAGAVPGPARLRGDRLLAGGRVRGLGSAKLANFTKFCKFSAGSFSAVSKRNFARKCAFDSIFQGLQDLYTSAPPQSQNFNKKSV